MEIEHVEHVMGIPIVGLACLSLFVLLFLAGAIGGLVVIIKLISGPGQSHAVHWEHAPRQTRPIFKGLAVGLMVMFLIAGFFVTGIRTVTHQQAAIRVEEAIEHQNSEMARSHAAAATQRAREDAEAALRRAREQVSAPLTVRLPQVPSIPPVEPVSAVDAVAAAEVSEPPTADRTTSADSATSPTPEWIKAGTITQGERRFLVLSSKQYATQAEAEQDVGRQTVELLRQDLREHTRTAWVQPGEIVGIPESLEGAIKQRHVETIQRDFGSFFAPMYRVWYQVELSPAVREPALVRWKGALTQSRLIATLGTLAALLMIPVGIVMHGVSNRATGGRANLLLKCLLVVMVVAVWLSGLAIFKSSLVLWR